MILNDDGSAWLTCPDPECTSSCLTVLTASIEGDGPYVKNVDLEVHCHNCGTDFVLNIDNEFKGEDEPLRVVLNRKGVRRA